MDADPNLKGFILQEASRPVGAPQTEPSAESSEAVSAAPSGLLLQMIPVGVVVYDSRGCVMECNEAAARLLGQTQEELLTRSSTSAEWDMIDEADQPIASADFPVNRVLCAKNSVSEISMGALQADGKSRVWLLISAEPIFDSCGRLVYVVSTFTDITERRRAEVARLDSEARYRLLFDSSPQPTWVYNSETLQILAVNRAAVEQYGYTREEFLGLTLPDLYAEPEAPPQEPSEIEEDASPETEIWKHRRKDGLPLDIRITTQTLRYCEQDARLVIAENITGRRHTERTLKRLNKRIANILESIRDGFVTLDRQWQFTYLNSRAEQIFHARRDELMGKNYWEIFPELRREAHYYNEFRRAMQKQNPVELEHRFATSGVWLKVNVYPSQDGLSIYMADVTDRKRVEQELQDTIGSLKRSVDGIVRAMSYAVELRDPYTAGHQQRVSLLVCAMARQMGFNAEEIKLLRVAALLHDIGKIAMPAEILSKPGNLSRAEMSIIQNHAQIGYDILKGIDFDPRIALVAFQHHERLDGSGYPNALGADDIIPEAKMMAVADVVEAMASHRPFRPSLGIEKALNEALRNKGILYDSMAVEACLAVFAHHGFDFDNLLRFEKEAIPTENGS